MTKTPLDNDVTCIYCGINKAQWKCELEAGEVRLTAPLCNVCVNLPDTILIGLIIGRKEMKRDHFAVIFANHNIQNVIAGSKKEAIVLAQAQQIEAGLDYNVEAVFMESARTADDEIVKWKKEGEIV